MRPLDETNRQLVQALQHDARLSVAEPARRLRRSEATIRERIAILQTKGVIRRYVADVDLEKVGLGAAVVVRGAVDMREISRLKEELARIPHVVAASVLSGQRPIRIRMVGRTLAEIQAVITKQIMPLGLDDVDTRVVLSTVVPSRGPDLQAFAILA